MAREIKFRVWDTGVKEMAKTGFSISDRGSVSFYWNSKPFHSNNAILLQYTGLKDKNGKEIYEGDIVEKITYPNQVFEVKFERGAFNIAGYHMQYCRIKGNIYENPELLAPVPENK